MSDVLDAEVVIVGAGPVGLTLAILLGQCGRDVVVLERWPEPYPLPRAVHFDHEIGRILQSCGIGGDLRRISEPAEVYEWRNGDGITLLRFGRIGAGASGWPESSMFCQPDFEALLEARAASLPSVVIRRGVEVTSLVEEDDHVVVGVGEAPAVRTRYVVGCDGANSTVRSLLDLDVVDLGFFYDWLVVDVVLDEPRVFDPVNLQICDPTRPTTAVSGGPGRRRWEFMRLPDESIEDLEAEARAWELLSIWDVRPDNARLERHAVYRFQARHAERWREGRVLIAGDAAHQMPPFAGQGMCAGIRDAANLAWKLDAVLDGVAGDELLDTYQLERLPHARRAIEFSMELGKVICVPDPAEAAERDALMSAGVTDALTEAPELPGLDAGFLRVGDPQAGRLAAQPLVDDGRLFDDVHGVGWRLVTTEEAPLTGVLVEWFSTIGGRIVHVAVDEPAWGATWLLQRPDFHIYGTAADAGGAQGLLLDLRDRLAATIDPTTRGVHP